MNFRHGVGQQIFRSPANDSATVHCYTSTSPDTLSNSMLLKLKGVERKEWGRAKDGCSLK